MSKESGARLRQLREETKETQLQMSKLLGLKSKQAYFAIERGANLNFENLVTVAKHFGVTTDYITGASPYRNAKDLEASMGMYI